jgi:hypothetical protein
VTGHGSACFVVEFLRVGCDTKSWSATVPSLSDASLIRAIKANHALASKSIEFDWEEDGKTAGILVGGSRLVGIVRVLNGAKIL